MFDYQRSTSLVTGASSGLGAAFAKALAKRGSNLVLVARRQAALDELAARLRAEHGVQVTTEVCDLSDSRERQRLYEAVSSKGLSINLLINNAGFGLSGAFLSHQLAEEEQQIQVNVTAVTALAHLFGRPMIRFGYNSGIINVASNAAFQPLPYSAVYSAAKSFVLLFSEALGRELKSQGTHVMALCPGAIQTEFWQKIGSALPDNEKSTPEAIVEEALSAFERRKAVFVPGPLKLRLQIFSTRFAPRSMVVQVAERASRSIMMRGKTPSGTSSS